MKDVEFANGTGFKLVAKAFFNDVALTGQLEQVYDMWDPTEHSSFKDFLRSLRDG